MMITAIRTTYRGPDAAGRGARVTATDGSRQVTVPYDYALSPTRAHHAAAVALLQRVGADTGTALEWEGESRSGRGYVWREVPCHQWKQDAYGGWVCPTCECGPESCDGTAWTNWVR